MIRFTDLFPPYLVKLSELGEPINGEIVLTRPSVDHLKRYRGNDVQRQLMDTFYCRLFGANYCYHRSGEIIAPIVAEAEAEAAKPRKSLVLDILGEIIARLPLASIVRLRSVSHDWYDISWDPYTFQSHLLLHGSDLHLVIGYGCMHLIERNRNEQMSTVFRLNQQPYGKIVLGSINGIICFKDRWGASGFYLYNPLRDEKKDLQSHGYYWIDDEVPFGFYCRYGFGFDHVRSEFKIVIFHQRRENDNMLLVITCAVPMRNGTPSEWKPIESKLVVSFACPAKPLGLVNGKLHCLSYTRGTEIIAFDTTTEEITAMPLLFPHPSFDIHNRAENVGNLGGCLFVTISADLTPDLPHENLTLTLWVMEVYGNQISWTKKLSLHIEKWYKQINPYMLSQDEILLLDNFNFQVDPYIVQITPSLGPN